LFGAGAAALIPYARNARTHSDQQVAQLAASIREFGFTNPVLIDEEDGIIAGHGRVPRSAIVGAGIGPSDSMLLPERIKSRDTSLSGSRNHCPSRSRSL
jgi:hypothetical protein